jgi:hypothetical protein
VRDDHELETVRAQVRDGSLFSPAVTVQIDALRASVHRQLRERGIDPTSPECERMWLVAGGVVGRLLASPETTALLAGQKDDEQRASLAALVMWSAGISPHESAEVAP